MTVKKSTHNSAVNATVTDESNEPFINPSLTIRRKADWLRRPFTRRQFMTLAGVGGVAATVGASWSVNLYTSSFFDKLSIKEYHFQSPQWPKDYPDLTIAFLTDLHVGCQSVGFPELKKIVEQVNAMNCDLILLGGDYLTAKEAKPWQPYIPPEPIASTLAPLTAKLGVFSVLGNHDWYNDGPGIWRALQQQGIQVLENKPVFVPYGRGGFWIVGLADYLTRTPMYHKTMARAYGPHPKIVLSHDPYTFYDMPSAAMIQLSGHTHGGQVRIPGLGPLVTPTPGTPLDWFYGMVEEDGNHMIVSSGVGTSRLPIKNTPCEVVKLTITSLEEKPDKV
jgi:predicted MPP superfamily phosphohydrolase